MASTLEATCTVGTTWTYENEDNVIATVRSQKTNTFSVTMESGTGDNQSNAVWFDERELVATSETLDLSGSLEDVFGTTLLFTKIKALYIKNTSETTTEIIAVGGAAANQWDTWVANASDIVKVGPSGCLSLVNPIDGYVVTAGTGDNLKIDAGSDTITYQIIIIGTV